MRAVPPTRDWRAGATRWGGLGLTVGQKSSGGVCGGAQQLSILRGILGVMRGWDGHNGSGAPRLTLTGLELALDPGP